MGLQLLHPLWLLALLLLVPTIWLGRQDSRLAPQRRRWSMILRAAVLTAIVLALAQPRLLLPVKARSVGFLVDVSDSVPAAERSRAETFVADAIGKLKTDDRAAVIAFGDRPLIDRPARSGPFETLRSVPGRERTDVGAALRLGLAVLPADTSRRLVLASDGRANKGPLDQPLALAQAQGVPIDVVPLAASASATEVLLRSFEAPPNTRLGQRFDLTAVVRANAPTTARLQILADQKTLYDRDVDLAAGDNRFAVPVTVGAEGFNRYQARVVPAQDGRAENNQAAAYTWVAGAPQILVVASVPDRAGPLMSALAGAGRKAKLVAPADVPPSLLALTPYESIILFDVPARELSGDAMRAIEAFVRDQGHGLVMIGGEDSFGAGGYKDTPVEKAMPVDMEVRDKEKRPDVAIAFVIDKSGSMSECPACGQYGGGGPIGSQRKVDLAKEAVRQAAMLLEPSDQSALVAFDDRSYTLWPLQTNEDPARFSSVVAGINADGGTNIYSGLAAAVDEVEGAAAPLKHVILLTDGWSDATGYERVLSRMDAHGITLSIVAIGQGSASYLKQLAEDGGGRYYAVVNPADVPQVFVDDTMTTLGTYIVEERFQPVPGARSQIMAGLDPLQVPALNGYNGTTAKQSAQVVLWSHLEDPVLAQWQYGLGRAVAWTSDLKRQWATDWVSWAPFANFAVQLVDWTLPAPDSAGLVTDVALDGAQATIKLKATDQGGEALNRLQVQAHLSGPDGQGAVVPLVQTAAGEYASTTELGKQGTYLLRVVAQQDGQVVGTQTAGVVVPYSPEYADPSDQPTDPRLWRVAELTGGRVLQAPADVLAPLGSVRRASDAWPWLFLLAVVLFPADVAVRRLKLGRADLVAAGQWLRARARLGRQGRGAIAAARGERALGTLFAARDQARTRMGGAAGDGVPTSTAATSPPPTTSSPGARPSGPATPPSTPAAPPSRPAVPPPDRPTGAAPPGATSADTLARLKQAKRRAQR
jgi:uncharacterized membrane protein